jgi:RNA polymerase sigma-70 factor (ECF subfamily)
MTKRPLNRGGHDSDTSVTLIDKLTHQTDDREVWNRFVDRYGPRILSWCRAWGLQAADAHDLTQIVLSKLLVEFHHFDYDPSRSFRAWLRKLTRRAWYDSIRQRRGEVSSDDPTVRALIEGQEAREDLVKRIEREFDLELLEVAEQRVRSRVKSSTWKAYHLIAVEQLPGIEVSRQLGMSVANVFMAKRNVLRMLKEEVKLLQSRQAEP